MLFFSDLENITKGKIIKTGGDLPVEYLLTDSRKLLVHPGAVFFAITGAHHDGHRYIEELYQKGIRQFITEKAVSSQDLPEANILQVKNSLLALQQIAAHHRQQYQLTAVGITGSNGKTIVKEWLSQMLSSKLKVVKSPKSYNSQLGVPLSVWQIRQEHEIGIFEAGISQQGEMQRLEVVMQPDIGIFTNIGTAHDEGFTNKHQKLLEKCKLFKRSRKIIYCCDHKEVHELLHTTYRQAALFSWGKSEECNVNILAVNKATSSTEISLHFEGQQITFTLPFNDDASIENCLHCVAFLLSEEFTPAFIQQEINLLDKVSKRLELKQGIHGCYVVDDTYNNDFGGLQIALEFMGQQKQPEKKTVILSDLLQTGMEEAELYEDIAALLANKGIHRLIGIGPAIQRNREQFKIASSFFTTTDDFLADISRKDFKDELILIKGAREFHFGRLVDFLQQKMHGTVLEINLDALTHNLNFYRSKIAPKTKLMVMVKAFAYGSGSQEIANLLQFHRVDYLAVAYPDEGVTLREHGINLPIMVMNPSPANFEQMVRYQLEPEIYSLSLLKNWSNFIKNKDKVVAIHLKLDTGMHRLGFEKHALEELNAILQANPELKVASIFTHLAGSDEAGHNAFSHYQAALFKEMTDAIISKTKVKPLLHILNSPGIIRFPEYHFDMVRLGIGLYGVEVSKLNQEQLLPISTLKTTISQIKHLHKGETVGYGRHGVAEKDMVLATIAIGYADGFDRRFSRGRGKVMVGGVEAPVVGNVCMDMTMVDITGIAAEEGDEVIIFGKERSISTLADDIGTIPYEILTNVNERVKRIFFTE